MNFNFRKSNTIFNISKKYNRETFSASGNVKADSTNLFKFILIRKEFWLGMFCKNEHMSIVKV